MATEGDHIEDRVVSITIHTNEEELSSVSFKNHLSPCKCQQEGSCNSKESPALRFERLKKCPPQYRAGSPENEKNQVVSGKGATPVTQGSLYQGALSTH